MNSQERESVLYPQNLDTLPIYSKRDERSPISRNRRTMQMTDAKKYLIPDAKQDTEMCRFL
jgi:hypothetical protein